MWFWFSLIALICWSGSDLFSKIGCQDADDKYSHLKMVMAVGLVMGLHAAYEIFINGTEINGSIILTYLPVSLLYISSMTIGYIGLRYIELSISSPICNSSGALVAVLALAFFLVGIAKGSVMNTCTILVSDNSAGASWCRRSWPPQHWYAWASSVWASWRPGRTTTCGPHGSRPATTATPSRRWR